MAFLRLVPLVSLLVGCPTAPIVDAGRDAPLAVDAPSLDAPMDDAGRDVGIADAPAPSCADGGPIDLVAACEAAATDMSTRCGGGSDRECEWLAIRDLCATERAEVLLEDMACTAAFSSAPGGTGCRTFSDPSGAAGCIISAHACFDVTNAAAVAGQVDAAFASLCGSSGGASPLHQAAVPFAALSDETLSDLDACLPAADCASLRSCVLGEFSTIFACFP
jgi:hypothetical protein